MCSPTVWGGYGFPACHQLSFCINVSKSLLLGVWLHGVWGIKLASWAVRPWHVVLLVTSGNEKTALGRLWREDEVFRADIKWKEPGSVCLWVERRFGPSPPVSHFHEPLASARGWVALTEIFCGVYSHRNHAGCCFALHTLRAVCVFPRQSVVMWGLVSNFLKVILWGLLDCFSSTVLNDLIVQHPLITVAVF